MLIDFRVKNFRSFRNESVLSMSASTDKATATQNVADTGNRSVPRLLKSAGIYGANASGKSNFVRAMQLMRGVVAESASLQPHQELNVQPFRLDPAVANDPTELEVTFFLRGARYQYGFCLTTTRIVEEWLIVYRTAHPQVWFTRNYDSEKGSDEYKIGPYLHDRRRNLWREATTHNSLFLSRAVQLNSEQLKPVFDWITGALVIFENGSIPIPNYTIGYVSTGRSKEIARFLSSADIGIEDIQIKKSQGIVQSVNFDFATGKVDINKQEQEVSVATFEHKSPAGSAVFDYADESEGTQKLFCLAGPIFDIFKEGRVLVVDELDRSLHALLVRQLIGMFHDPEINKHNAQLVFTTHDTSLLDSGLLRRDQIWFSEKDGDAATRLSPLSDFSPRKNEALERGYLSGRYGGVPILKRLRA
jgi:uncharacterized protein